MLVTKRNIQHDGQTFGPDEEFTATITDEQKQALLDDGALVEVKSKSEAKRLAAQEEATPEKTVETPASDTADKALADDKKEEDLGTPAPTWPKQRLLDYAASKNITVDPSQTRNEIFTAITGEADNEPETPETPETPAV